MFASKNASVGGWVGMLMLVAAADVSAETLKVVNRSNRTVAVARSYYVPQGDPGDLAVVPDPAHYRVEGWFTVRPGQTIELYFPSSRACVHFTGNVVPSRYHNKVSCMVHPGLFDYKVHPGVNKVESANWEHNGRRRSVAVFQTTEQANREGWRNEWFYEIDTGTFIIN